MKIAVDSGHTLSGADYGAVGIIPESVLTREVGKKVMEKFKSLGHTVIDCTLDSCSSLGQSLGYRVNKSNYYNIDIFISIHFNCFNKQAHGTEVWTYGGKQFQEASRVVNKLSSLGFYNRGIKDGSNLYVLKHTKAKAMLIEVCFCDNATDMQKYNTDNVAKAIVEGITGQKINNTIQQQQERTSNPNIDHSIPNFEGITPFREGLGYIQVLKDRGRIDIHLDRHNYLTIQDNEKEGNRVFITTRTKGSKNLI